MASGTTEDKPAIDGTTNGPYIVLGGLVYLFFGPQLIETYLEMLYAPGVIALSAFFV